VWERCREWKERRESWLEAVGVRRGGRRRGVDERVNK